MMRLLQQSGWPALRRRLQAFRRDERGSLVFWFALGLVPLLLAVGSGLDYGRSINLKAQLQGAADSAALAGAGAYVDAGSASNARAVATTYMNNFATAMGGSYGVTFTVATAATNVGSTATAYAVTVTASGKLANSIMALSSATNTVAVTAVARNPVYTLTLTASQFSSSALDANTISYYIVPSDGSAPDPSTATPLFSNHSSATPPPVTIQLTASQKVGFMLTNTTGAYGNYGNNQYTGYAPSGSANGSYGATQYFYSHLFPPSLKAYPTWRQNCSLQVGSSGAGVGGGCFNSNFPNSAINCASVPGQTLVYSWNDMGGATDDHDYNDMVYTVQCSRNDTTIGTGVVLTN